ncbi:MAG: hypothetical protein M3378_12230 [Actinomycetota bacterium]|nr:hypothetical protein [Actinomycetota bacterium]
MTIAAVAVIVGALAIYLILIAGILVKVSSNLSKILNEVILDVADKTGNVGSVVSSIADEVGAVEQTMASVASSGRPPPAYEPAYEEEEEEVEEEAAYDEYEEVEVVEVERPRRRRARVRR